MGIEIVWTQLKVIDFEIKHEDVSSLLGLTPFDAYNKGDLLTFKNKKVKDRIADHDYWELRSDSDLISEDEGDYEDMFEAHISNILEKLLPVKDKFLEITKLGDTWIEMIVEFHEWHSYIELKREVTKQLAEFNLYIHFDLKYNSDKENEEEK